MKCRKFINVPTALMLTIWTMTAGAQSPEISDSTLCEAPYALDSTEAVIDVGLLSDSIVQPNTEIYIREYYSFPSGKDEMLKTLRPDTTHLSEAWPDMKGKPVPTIYSFPYSKTQDVPDSHRLWVNTAVLGGAFVSTLFVLECLPEDATAWNRAAIQKRPLFKRWWRNIFKRGPEWDHDNPIFNYVLHPYAGAAYFMAARGVGYNFWKSFLYSACVSSLGWEFGIEAFMERPSYQDLVITPCVGSLLGECFYRVKRSLVENNYRLAGSKLLGNIVAFFIDPVNEVVDIFRGNRARQYSDELERKRSSKVSSSLMPTMISGNPGFTFKCTF